jgi:hypothetical protein
MENNCTVLLYTMNYHQYRDNQTRCLATMTAKGEKRYNRANFTIDEMSKDDNTSYFDIIREKIELSLVRSINLLMPKQNDVTLEQVIHFLEHPSVIVPGSVIRVNLDPNLLNEHHCTEKHNNVIQSIKTLFNGSATQKDIVKKTIEAALTSKISTEIVYELTSAYFKKIVQKLGENEVIRPYIINRDIIFELKGGMAAKKLFSIYSMNRAEVDRIFSNSDNDCSILINPELPDDVFNGLHYLISTIIHEQMKELTNELAFSLQDVINSVEQDGVTVMDHNMTLLHSPVCGFTGRIQGNQNVLTYDEERFIKIQNNEIKFLDAVCCLHHFLLLRWKLPFVCIFREYFTTICGELLDISIPYKDECTLKASFKERNAMIPVDWVNVIYN